jgi:hypothetical protein
MPQETASPLSWPQGWPRSKVRQRARFERRETRYQDQRRADGSTFQTAFQMHRQVTVAAALRKEKESHGNE